MICTPYMIGAVSALSPEQERQYSRLPKGQKHPILVAYEEFQKYLGVKFYGTTACELGGSNTAMAFFPAVMSDHYILDADPAGRAVPEITHSTYYLAGLPAAPIYTANEFGETFVLEGVCDDQRAETIVRALSQVSRNDLAAIDHALPMRELRNALIPGTISKALEIGKIWRETLEVDGDAISEVTRLSGGLEVFQGRVSLADYETIEGFTKGFLVIDGLGKFSGQSMQVSVKNENMACWINGQVFATVPDLICMFGAETQKPWQIQIVRSVNRSRLSYFPHRKFFAQQRDSKHSDQGMQVCRRHMLGQARQEKFDQGLLAFVSNFSATPIAPSTGATVKLIVSLRRCQPAFPYLEMLSAFCNDIEKHNTLFRVGRDHRQCPGDLFSAVSGRLHEVAGNERN